MTSLDMVAILQSTPLDKVLDLLLDRKTLTFLDMLRIEALQMLSIQTKPIARNPKNPKLDKSTNPTLNKRSRPKVIVEVALEMIGDTPMPSPSLAQPEVTSQSHPSFAELHQLWKKSTNQLSAQLVEELEAHPKV